MLARSMSLVAVLLAAASRAGAAQATTAELDAIAKRVVADEHIVGASVLVARGTQILLHKGYGFADLGLEAATKPETVYHIVGPMLPFTGVAVMQLIEQGKLSLDDELAKYVPEFPLQGRRVTVRQLLDHTSGVVDYHYLGDPIEATSRIPKALDEVMALYAGKKWVNEPGMKWDWSISGFQLLVTIIERVSGQRFADYVQTHLFTPAGLASTSYCDDYGVVRGLSHSYRRSGGSVVPANENDMAYNADLRICSTVGDFHRLWTALRAGKLLKPETFKLMATAEGAGARQNPQDPKAQYGLALTINHEGDHRRFGQHGSLFGYSGSLYEYPDDNLTIVVLTNTEGQNAFAITRALSRAVLGLPALPAATRPPERTIADAAISPAERTQLDGTYLLKLDRLTPELHDSYAQYERTYRVFDENGRLMIQTLGEGPERLLKQEDGTFALRSQPRRRISFSMEGGRATGLKLDPQGSG
ncbi:MAG: serine hydrolase domain-containing protein, partial [Gemmatimonadota bacterium]